MIGRSPHTDTRAEILFTSAASMARESRTAVSVLLRRSPTIVAQARAIAQQAGVSVTIEVRASTICARFTLADG
jgi:hypothetical protein